MNTDSQSHDLTRAASQPVLFTGDYLKLEKQGSSGKLISNKRILQPLMDRHGSVDYQTRIGSAKH